jgi:hypothetical protein
MDLSTKTPAGDQTMLPRASHRSLEAAATAWMEDFVFPLQNSDIRAIWQAGFR